MKRSISIVLILFMCGALCACQNTTQTNDSDALSSVDQVAGEQVSRQISDEQTEKNTKGTRSNPYHFGEDIVFSTMYGGEVITYTMNFSEIVQGYATRNLLENPGGIDESDMVIRASVSVTGEFDDAIYMPIYLTLLDVNFNEFLNGMPDAPVKTANGKK